MFVLRNIKNNPAYILIIAWTFIFLSAAAAIAGNVTLTWSPSLFNKDGTPLTDFAGYALYYGPASGDYTNSIDIGNVTTYQLYGLPEGMTWYFSVTAYDTSGNESEYSNQVARFIPQSSDVPNPPSTDPGAAYQCKLPDGYYFAHTCGRDSAVKDGGDDDHTGIYFLEVDPAVADGTTAPDIYIYLFDGDNDADLNPGSSGTDDIRPAWLSDLSGDSIFEYRLYGGTGASINDDPLDGGDPVSYGGSIININTLTNRTSLRTDLDGPSGTGLLMDQQNTIIAVDIDSNPGDLVNGRYVYKFVVDGSLGVKAGGDTATDWNRYQIDVSTDSSDPNAGDCPNPLVSSNCVSLFAYELTFAGSPSPITTDTYLFVPNLSDHKLDIQTLDLDESQNPLWPTIPTTSILTLPDSTTFDESQTFEGGDQVLNGVAPYYWTSLNQPERVIPGEEFPSAKDGATCGPGPFTPDAGLCYDTTGNENKVWSLKIDPALSYNPFSIRAFGDVQNPAPTSIRLIPVPGEVL